MKQTFTLACILFILPFALLAQADFRKARAISINGDTLYGAVNLREWNLNPKSFEFRASTSATVTTTLTPATTAYLEIEGVDTYKRFAGPISMNYLEVSKLPVVPDLNTQPDTIFLRQLHKGEHVALYTFTDRVKTRYFAENVKSGLVQELYFAKYLSQANGRQVQYINQYRGQLWGIATATGNTNSKLQQKIERADYKEVQLLQLVKMMNGLEGADAVKEKDSRRQSSFYGGLALNRSLASVTDSHPLVKEENNSVSYSPYIALGVLTYFNKNTKRLGVRWEAAYTFSEHDASYTKGESGLISYTVRTFEQRYHNISIAPQLHYTFYGNGQWSMFLNAGFSANYAFVYDNTMLTEHHYFNDKMEKVVMTFSTNELDSNQLWFGIPLRIGATWGDKYEAILGYSYSIKPGLLDQVQINNLQLGIFYHFGR